MLRLHHGATLIFVPDLFKGFAAKASDKAIEAVNALGDKYLPTIEQDITFSTQDE